MKRLATCAALAAWLTATPLAAQDSAPPDRRIEAALGTDGQRAIEGINGFSLALYRATGAAGGNVFLSPASVSTAIGLAYRGARGATADELRRVMRYDSPPEAYLQTDAAVLASMNFAGAGRELRVANALWFERDLPLRPDYVDDVTRRVGAGIQRVDFRRGPDIARTTINHWVAVATNEHIRNLLHKGDVTDQTRVALVDAIYWKGAWATPFAVAATKVEPFRSLGGKQIPMPLMHQRATFRAIARNGARAIEMPYAGGEVAMVVLLPDDPGGLTRFERTLMDGGMPRWLSDLDAAPARDTLLTLPRMHLEWRSELVSALVSLGATTAFGNDADFSGMAVEPFPGEVVGAKGLKIDKVVHQTYLNVDEQGSAATAATAVMDVVLSGRRVGPPPPPPFAFRADKPFLFLLRDRRTHLVLFIGRYVAPEA